MNRILNLSFSLILLVFCLIQVSNAAPMAPNASDPTLKAWFKADAISGLSNGDDVTSWVNSNLSGNNASPVSTAPTYVASDSSFGGLPSVSFIDSPLVTSSGLGITGDLSTTAFIVYQPNAGDLGVFGWGNVFSGLEAIGLFNQITTPVLRVEYAGSNSAISDLPGTTLSKIVELRKSPGAIDTTTQLWADGAGSTITGSSATPNVTNDPLYLGSWANLTGSNLLTGNIAELIVFDRVLSQSEADEIGGYLALKYDLSTLYPTALPVPEPGSASLLGLGLVGWVIARRKRKRANI